MKNKKAASNEKAVTGRGELIRRVIVFQFKLLLDGLRDLMLSPLSLLSAVAGLLLGGSDPAGPFRRVLALGRRTEGYIRLFDDPWQSRGDAGLDEVLHTLERRLRDSYAAQDESPRATRVMNALREAAVAARQHRDRPDE